MAPPHIRSGVQRPRRLGARAGPARRRLHANAVRIDKGWLTEADGKASGRSGTSTRPMRSSRRRARDPEEPAAALGDSVLGLVCAGRPQVVAAPGAWWDRGVDRYPPTDPRVRAAARWVVDRWGDDIAAIEVWNEPNYDAFFKTSDLNGDYAALLKAAYPEVGSRPRRHRARPRDADVGRRVARRALRRGHRQLRRDLHAPVQLRLRAR